MNRRLKYLVIDVDGTMTDAGIYYDENGNETKKFCTRDAAGFFAAHQVGITIIVLTGRECKATARRMTELRVGHLYQNVKIKADFLKKYMTEHNISKNNIGYIGDDLNDLPSMQLVGYTACPFDSCPEVKAHADYVSPVKGGYGAVRDIIEHILRESEEWDDAIAKAYGIGI
ncbi:MAG: HAD hydrolase family protein [Bacteroides fragilis]|nr:HAD hydrolase family protein [Bacteroides fragilis]